MNNLKDNLISLQEKAKERTVKTQSIEYDLETLIKKIDRKTIRLDPEYQRRHRWDDRTSSRLIESLILNIPIPTIYISQDVDVDSETEEARYSVIDGQQRLTAMFNFMKNKFKLEGLESLEELNGSLYQDLPPFLIRRLEERAVKCLRIDSTLDTQVKIDIFERLNSGSVKLEAQELRNAVFGGKFNDLCKELAKSSEYRKMLQIPSDDVDSNTKVKKMEDVEIVVRFFTLINGNYEHYKKTKERGFSEFMSECMRNNMKATDSEISNMRSVFNRTISIIYRDFGEKAFAKYRFSDSEGFELQSNFNVAVFDALAVGCHDLIFSNQRDNFATKTEAFKNLFKNPEFHDSVSGSSVDSSKIKYRIEQSKVTLR